MNKKSLQKNSVNILISISCMDRCWLSDVHSCLKFLCLRNPCKLFYFVPFQFLIPYIFGIIVFQKLNAQILAKYLMSVTYVQVFSKHEQDAQESKIYLKKATIRLHISNNNLSNSNDLSLNIYSFCKNYFVEMLIRKNRFQISIE